MNLIVNQILSGLKTRLNNGRILVQSTGGYCYNAECLFNEPATESKIEQFHNETAFILPEDYRHFLSLHNGMTLFKGEFEGQIELYRIEEIPTHYKTFYDAFYSYLGDEEKDSYPIGYYTDVGMIMINNSTVKKGDSDYLWVTSIDSIVFPYDFQTWLDQTVMSQGNHYWTWCK
jgi:hypothetical protein